MGNPSTPSKACQPCRAKRRKCDKKLPGCSQCRRAKIECLGYRDDFSLRLRDQTARTAHRLQNLETCGEYVSPMLRSKSAAMQSVQSMQTTLDTLAIYRLPACPEAVALGYFLNVYAPTSLFDYIPEASALFLRSEPLKAALLAPSLLLLSQNFRLTMLQSLAQKEYVKALTLTNSALSSQELVTQDSTLLAVLLLSLYEALAFRGRRAPSGWDAHIKGAVYLLQLRGEKQFESSLGRGLFLHASGNLRVDCAQRGMEPPSALRALQDALMRTMDPRDPKIRLGPILDGFANLRASIGNSSPLARFHKARELDQELAIVLDDLCRLAPFEVIGRAALPGHVTAYNDCVHQYTAQRMSKLWNSVRVLRLFINDHLYHYLTIQRVFGNLDSEECARAREEVVATGTMIISDVLGSVPLLIEPPENAMISARSLIYPLVCVAVSSLATPCAIKFAHDTLAFIGSRYGLVQAAKSAHMVMQTKNLEEWVHLSLVS